MNTEKYILDGSKLLCHPDYANAWLRGERIAPITIDCIVTTRCRYEAAGKVFLMED